MRNILLIIQRRPAVLKNDVKVFFCKYNDPIYVKLAKLEIMYRLASEENVKEVLAELEEYVVMSLGRRVMIINYHVQVRIGGRHRLCAQSRALNRTHHDQSRRSR